MPKFAEKPIKFGPESKERSRVQHDSHLRLSGRPLPISSFFFFRKGYLLPFLLPLTTGSCLV